MRERRVLWVALALTLVACDPGPHGPGAIGGSVESSQGSVRGAVLEIHGDNLHRVEAQSGTWLFQRPMEQQGGVRLVLVSQGDHAPTIRIHLQDLSGSLPQAVLLELSDVEDRPFQTVQGARVRFFR
ncbi:MAG: hypothetical protein WEA09_08130 [Gemmatimonadota bacterium]